MSATTHQQLSNITVGDLVANKTQTYCIDSGDSLQSALEMMRKYSILSLPVTGTNGNIEGMISIMDILVYVAWAPFGDTVSQEQSDVKLGSSVKALLGLTGESRTVHVIEGKFPLVSLAAPFAAGLHRVLVQQKISENQTIYRVLSQSDVIKHLYSKRAELSVHMARKLQELIPPKKIIAIHETNSALDGFKEMSMSKVQAVAVTDSVTGEILANLAASDLRGISSEGFSEVTLPVMVFLKKVRGQAFRVLSVTMENTLEEAVKIIVENNIHRLWIVAGENQNKGAPLTPIGILSMSDIFKTFFPPPTQQDNL